MCGSLLFYPDSGLCSPATVTLKYVVLHTVRPVRTFCEFCLQTPVLCSSSTVILKYLMVRTNSLCMCAFFISKRTCAHVCINGNTSVFVAACSVNCTHCLILMLSVSIIKQNNPLWNVKNEELLSDWLRVCQVSPEWNLTGRSWRLEGNAEIHLAQDAFALEAAGSPSRRFEQALSFRLGLKPGGDSELRTTLQVHLVNNLARMHSQTRTYILLVSAL